MSQHILWLLLKNIKGKYRLVKDIIWTHFLEIKKTERFGYILNDEQFYKKYEETQNT